MISLVQSKKPFVEAEKKIESQLSAWMKAGKTILLLVAGGSVAQMYGELGKWLVEHAEKKNPLICVAQVDERFQPLREDDVNANTIGDTGFWGICDELSVPYHIVPQEGRLHAAVEKYDDALEQLFKKYDKKMAIMGMGEDGHIAGLLPGYKQSWDRESYAVGYKNSERYPQRISITPHAIRSLDSVIGAAMGERKLPVLQQTKDGSGKGDINVLPSLLLYHVPEVFLYTDQKV